jgi:hypothetical protein
MLIDIIAFVLVIAAAYWYFIVKPKNDQKKDGTE